MSSGSVLFFLTWYTIYKKRERNLWLFLNFTEPKDLDKIPYILRTSRQSLSVIRQNFFGTLFVDGLGFVLAFMGIINPLLADIIHIGSELIFIANAPRLIVDN